MSRHEFADEERAILDARTRALARERHAAPPLLEVDAVEVVVASTLVAFEAGVLLGVTKVDHLAPLPHAPPSFAGLLYHRGSVLPTFYLSTALDLPLAALPEHGRIVIVGRDEPEIGLVVDRVERPLQLSRTSLEPVPLSLSSAGRALALGMIGSTLVIGGPALLESPAFIFDVPQPRIAASFQTRTK